jgi:hypothetical protein
VQIRKCAWSNQQEETRRIVWTRGGIVATNCPKSIITSQSQAWIEEFVAWKAFGGGMPWFMPAKSVEALLVLERAWQKEQQLEKP